MSDNPPLELWLAMFLTSPANEHTKNNDDDAISDAVFTNQIFNFGKMFD